MTDPRHSPKQLHGPLFPSQLSMSLGNSGTASGNKLLFRLPTTYISVPTEIIFTSDYLNLLTLRWVGQRIRTPYQSATPH